MTLAQTSENAVRNSDDSLNQRELSEVYEYPSKHYLQLLLPFTNEIFNSLNGAGILPKWLYNLDSTNLGERVIVYAINSLALSGIVWNVAYMSGKFKSELVGLLQGVGLVFMTYLIPNLCLRPLEEIFKSKLARLLASSIIIGLLLFLETVWSTLTEQFATRKNRTHQEMRKVSLIFVSVLTFSILIVVGSIAWYHVKRK